MSARPRTVMSAVKVHGEMDVLNAAIARIDSFFAWADTIVVGFSGGKDSTVLLNLILARAKQKDRKVYVAHADEEIVDPDTLRYVHAVSEWSDIDFRWFCIPIAHTLRSDHRPRWFPWNPAEKEIWYRDMPEKAIIHVPGFVQGEDHLHEVFEYTFAKPEFGNVAIFSAVRAGESANRRRGLMLRGRYWRNFSPTYRNVKAP